MPRSYYVAASLPPPLICLLPLLLPYYFIFTLRCHSRAADADAMLRLRFVIATFDVSLLILLIFAYFSPLDYFR